MNFRYLLYLPSTYVEVKNLKLLSTFEQNQWINLRTAIVITCMIIVEINLILVSPRMEVVLSTTSHQVYLFLSTFDSFTYCLVLYLSCTSQGASNCSSYNLLSYTRTIVWWYNCVLWCCDSDFVTQYKH